MSDAQRQPDQRDEQMLALAFAIERELRDVPQMATAWRLSEVLIGLAEQRPATSQPR